MNAHSTQQLLLSFKYVVMLISRLSVDKTPWVCLTYAAVPGAVVPAVLPALRRERQVGLCALSSDKSAE